MDGAHIVVRHTESGDKAERDKHPYGSFIKEPAT